MCVGGGGGKRGLSVGCHACVDWHDVWSLMFNWCVPLCCGTFGGFVIVFTIPVVPCFVMSSQDAEEADRNRHSLAQAEVGRMALERQLALQCSTDDPRNRYVVASGGSTAWNGGRPGGAVISRPCLALTVQYGSFVSSG